MTLRIAVPPEFHLDRVARSHGWYDLPPTSYGGGTLSRVLEPPQAGVTTVRITQDADGLVVATPRLRADDRSAVVRAVEHMLALDADLSGFYDACLRVPQFAWVPATGAGRLLRSPTVWEDLVKTLCTTNCSWSATRGMVVRLVGTLGTAGADGARAFPTAQAVTTAGVDHLRDVVRMGYRAAALHELAEAVASGSLQPEHWLDPRLPDEQVARELLALRGFGPYAVEGMLGLLGRPRGLAIDSWVRAKLPRLLGKRKMSDKQIAARYARLGRWGGTGLWVELTRDWFDESAPTLPT